MTLRDLPALNALLNAAAAVALLTGFWLIRRGRWRAHRAAMITALLLSSAFLTSYLVYHAQVGSVRFQGTGPLRALYLTILATHTVLAAAVPVLAIVTLSRALRRRFDRHRAIARWTLPIWLYVSVTGVVVYWMLYQL
jgi:putative membrane protein